MNITQLAIEAKVKRWHLTHQHTDLKDQFQADAVRMEAKRIVLTRSGDAHEEKRQHADLREHCRHLEIRLQIYATALNQLALENASLSGRDADAAKVRTLPRQQHMPLP
ncbi:hypothetical protein OG607_44910 [Streptomyces sp. NBC_01537]|uniref:hypothetical protein n=1 Tax=Streptomyces sp. NBC_01537 TaxID=2903896 RepID=UPI003867FD08